MSPQPPDSRPERRKDYNEFRQLLNRTGAQVGLLDAIEQGYTEHRAEIAKLLKRGLIAMTITGLLSLVAIGLSAYQIHKVRRVTAATNQTARANRALIARECRDTEALKAAARATLQHFAPKDAPSQARFAAHRCPHRPPREPNP
jgi:hypothetical protein